MPGEKNGCELSTDDERLTGNRVLTGDHIDRMTVDAMSSMELPSQSITCSALCGGEAYAVPQGYTIPRTTYDSDVADEEWAFLTFCLTAMRDFDFSHFVALNDQFVRRDPSPRPARIARTSSWRRPVPCGSGVREAGPVVHCPVRTGAINSSKQCAEIAERWARPLQYT
jgi:hypothetical protein